MVVVEIWIAKMNLTKSPWEGRTSSNFSHFAQHEDSNCWGDPTIPHPNSTKSHTWKTPTDSNGVKKKTTLHRGWLFDNQIPHICCLHSWFRDQIPVFLMLTVDDKARKILVQVHSILLNCGLNPSALSENIERIADSVHWMNSIHWMISSHGGWRAPQAYGWAPQVDSQDDDQSLRVWFRRGISCGWMGFSLE